MGYERSVKQIDDDLDDICLQMVQLMNDYCHSIGRLEHCLRDGCVHLAKTRYVIGNKNVSGLQLPSSGPFVARSSVIRQDDETVMLAKNNDGSDPIKMFGVLVPSSLRLAQGQFCKCLETTVEAATIKRNLDKLQKEFKDLKYKRNEIKE